MTDAVTLRKNANSYSVTGPPIHKSVIASSDNFLLAWPAGIVDSGWRQWRRLPPLASSVSQSNRTTTDVFRGGGMPNGDERLSLRFDDQDDPATAHPIRIPEVGCRLKRCPHSSSDRPTTTRERESEAAAPRPFHGFMLGSLGALSSRGWGGGERGELNRGASPTHSAVMVVAGLGWVRGEWGTVAHDLDRQHDEGRKQRKKK